MKIKKMNILKQQSALLITCLLISTSSVAHQHASPKHDSASHATYLGNEALLVEHNNTKVLFDPFFHNDYNTYQLVPEKIRNALMTGKEPYNDIDAIFISHAHGDHFSAEDVFTFLKSYPNAMLVAPRQAIDAIAELGPLDEIKDSLMPIELAYQDKPVNKKLGAIEFDVVRIPHAGWPQRANVSNLVFRVTLEGEITVVHMGDADPDDEHFKPLQEHWDIKKSDAAFPPYWFFTSQSGPLILNDRIKATENIGVHVPLNVPDDLRESKAKFFSSPEQKHEF